MKKPLLLSIICVIGFIGCILTVFGFLTSTLSPVSTVVLSIPLPTWYIVVSLLFVPVYFYGLIEIWKMRKRGIELYTIAAIIEYIIGFTFGFASVTGLVISAIAIGLIWIYYKRMTQPSFFTKNLNSANN